MNEKIEDTHFAQVETGPGGVANAINPQSIDFNYEKQQARERRQQMKLACLQLANQPTPDGNGGFAIDPVKVLATAKDYYKFVRT